MRQVNMTGESRFRRAMCGPWLRYAVLLFALLFPARPGESATITVTNLNDSGAGSLRQAIAAAASGDTITTNVTGTITLTTGELSIAKNLTITGPGSGSLTISGNNASRVLGVFAGNVNISGLTVRDGYANAGGGIGNWATLLLEDVVVTSNAATAGGGGIVSDTTTTLTIVNSLITGNTATPGGGGGIWSRGTLSISGSVISNNTSDTCGGGIENDEYATATITDSSVVGNRSGCGGGIYNIKKLTLTNTTISGNQAIGADGGDGGWGGGIFSYHDLWVTYSVISSNTAAQAGGGIFAEHTRSSSFTNAISYSSITDNSAGDKGGGIFFNNGALTLVEDTISGNSAHYGGGVYINDDAVLSANLTVSGNYASVNGGGIYANGTAFGGGSYAHGSTLYFGLRDSTISGNSSGAAGGGIYTSFGVFNINSSTISGNTAASMGGGIFNSAYLTITNSTISANAGYGIKTVGAGTDMKNTILAQNSNSHDCYGPLISNDYNLIESTSGCIISGTTTNNIYGKNPLLGPLQNNGGSTFTHALLAGSPAIDAGGGCSDSDQRGASRPNGVCDIGAVELTSAELADLVPPQSNALDFDGVDDYVNVPDADALDLTSSYTIEAWIKPAAFKALGGIVSKYHTVNSNGYTLRLGTKGNYSGINFDEKETAGGVLQLGKWQHVAAVNDNGTRHVYVNGVEQPLTGTALIPAANTDPVKIGSDFNGRYFKGAIDEVRIWSKARTQAEIHSSLSTTVAANTAGLVAYYRFDQGSAGSSNTGETTLNGLTTPAFDGTLNNFSLSGGTSNWVASGAVQPFWGVYPSADEGGSISPNTVQTVINNDTVSFFITPSAGYAIDIATGCNGTLSGNIYTTGLITESCPVMVTFAAIVDGACGSDNGKTLAAMPVQLCAIGTPSTVSGTGLLTWTCAGANSGTTANCSAEIQTHTLTIAAAGTGTGAIGGSGTYNYGTTHAVTANASVGSTFTGWSGDCAGNASPLDVLINGNKACTATFTLNTYTLMFNNGGNGTITGTVSQTVNHGSSATEVTAVAASNYHFVNWTGTNGFVTTSANPLTIANVTAAMNITANFAHDAVNGACGADHNQTIMATMPTNVCSAGIASAVTGTGHPWTWTCDGQYGGTSVDCTANIQIYALTFNTDGNGTLNGAASQTLDHGTSASAVTAVPSAGYHFVNWTGTNGFATTSTNPLVVSSATATVGITAHFSHDAVNGACGSDNGQTVAATAPTNLCAAGTASSVSGTGHPWSWTCDGQYGGTSANCSATVQTYTLTFNTDGNGTLTGTTSQTVDYGGSASAVTASATSGYSFVNWTGTKGFATTSTNPLIVSNVTADMNITGNFSAGAVNGACGSDHNQTLAAGAPTNLCAAGTASTVSGTGHPWDWTCSGLNSGTTANCSANIQTYTLTFTSDGNGTLSGTTSQTVDYGASAGAVQASPANGYAFVNWTGTNGFTTTSANPLTMSNVVSGYTITASFSDAAINGACGSSNDKTLAATPANNLCASGTASSVTGSGPWTWTCSGLNGGTTANCSASMAPAIPSGDLTGDGTVNAADALKALRIASGLDTASSSDLEKGDVAPIVNGTPHPDGMINIGDVVVILRKAVGLVTW